LFPIEEVQIVPLPDFNNLQPLIPDEIPFEDLLGFVNAPHTMSKTILNSYMWVWSRCLTFMWILTFMKDFSQLLFQSLLLKLSDSR